jgi:cytochrome P450 family 6
MRRMHPIIIDCVKRLENALEKGMKIKNEVEIKQYMSNFTIDVIASCAFGTKIDTYSEKRNEFIIKAQKAFRGTWRIWVFFTLAFTFPKLIQWMKFRFIEPSVTDFFRAAVSMIFISKSFLTLFVFRSDRLSAVESNKRVNIMITYN